MINKLIPSNTGHPTPASHFLDRQQLAARWHCSVSHLKRLEKRGDLPATRLGPRLLRYSLTQIEAIENGR